jgi:uncharacterized membrane protein YphA (DoxX/SURF4 family)
MKIRQDRGAELSIAAMAGGAGSPAGDLAPSPPHPALRQSRGHLVRLEGRRGLAPRLPQESWRAHGIGVLRIAFGLVWAVDAYFKWQPAFLNHLTDYVTGALPGQPGAVKSWIHFWHHIIGVDPHVFAYLVAAGETAVALALILGVFSNLAYGVGILLSLVIWSTAEGSVGLTRVAQQTSALP